MSIFLKTTTPERITIVLSPAVLYVGLCEVQVGPIFTIFPAAMYIRLAEHSPNIFINIASGTELSGLCLNVVSKGEQVDR